MMVVVSNLTNNSWEPGDALVGVPVTIHLRSTLRMFEKMAYSVRFSAVLWPSSTTMRFHRIWRSGETSLRRLHLHRRISLQSHTFHECRLSTFFFFASVENPRYE